MDTREQQQADHSVECAPHRMPIPRFADPVRPDAFPRGDHDVRALAEGVSGGIPGLDWRRQVDVEKARHLAAGESQPGQHGICLAPVRLAEHGNLPELLRPAIGNQCSVIGGTIVDHDDLERLGS